VPPATPVRVGCGVPVAADLLVNLAAEVPPFYAGYARVADFVDAEAGRRDAGRRRYAYYRERGLAPETKIVTYCTIGNRAAQAWYALKHLLGYRDVSVYYGSWTEWGKSADTPINS
jgi:3-mercaptopyruvate sulfurtransferase SseA